jgi:hypothetical protein
MKRIIFTFIILSITTISNAQFFDPKDTTKSDMEINREHLLNNFYQMVNQKKYEDQDLNFEDNLFLNRTWADGWYCLGGAGYSLFTIDNPEHSRHYYPTAFNVSSALGYHSPGGYAYEFGSYIDVVDINDFKAQRANAGQIDPNFQSVNEMDLIAWNTVFYIGIRARFPNVIRPTNNFNPYAKIFYGRGVTVYFPGDTDDDEATTNLSDKRIHMEGAVFGFSISNVFNMYNKKPIWFLELTFQTQMYRDMFFVQENGDLDLELNKAPATDGSLYYVLRLTIGSRFF